MRKPSLLGSRPPVSTRVPSFEGLLDELAHRLHQRGRRRDVAIRLGMADERQVLHGLSSGGSIKRRTTPRRNRHGSRTFFTVDRVRQTFRAPAPRRTYYPRLMEPRIFKWSCFGLAAVVCAVLLYLVNDMRRELRRTNETINVHLPQIVVNVNAATTTLAAVSKDVNAFRDLAGLADASGQDRSLVTYADSVLDFLEQRPQGQVGLEKLVGSGLKDVISERRAGRATRGRKRCGSRSAHRRRRTYSSGSARTSSVRIGTSPRPASSR